MERKKNVTKQLQYGCYLWKKDYRKVEEAAISVHFQAACHKRQDRNADFSWNPQLLVPYTRTYFTKKRWKLRQSYYKSRNILCKIGGKRYEKIGFIGLGKHGASNGQKI